MASQTTGHPRTRALRALERGRWRRNFAGAQSWPPVPASPVHRVLTLGAAEDFDARSCLVLACGGDLGCWRLRRLGLHVRLGWGSVRRIEPRRRRREQLLWRRRHPVRTDVALHRRRRSAGDRLLRRKLHGLASVPVRRRVLRVRHPGRMHEQRRLRRVDADLLHSAKRRRQLRRRTLRRQVLGRLRQRRHPGVRSQRFTADVPQRAAVRERPHLRGVAAVTGLRRVRRLLSAARIADDQVRAERRLSWRAAT